MQPVVYADSGELVISDFQLGSGGGPPSVVDIAFGQSHRPLATGLRVASGMFLSAATGRRVLYARTTAVALAALS